MLVTIATNIKPLDNVQGNLAIDGFAITFTPYDTSIPDIVTTVAGFERQLIERIPDSIILRDTEALKYVGVPIIDAHTRSGTLWCHEASGDEFGFVIAGHGVLDGAERERPRISQFLRRLDPDPFGKPQYSNFPGKQPLIGT